MGREHSLSISAAEESEVRIALQLVFRNLVEPARSLQIAAAFDEIGHSPKPNCILLLARRGVELVGAIWAQVRAGRVAALWPPGLREFEDQTTAIALVTTAVLDATAARAKLVHSLLDKDQFSEAVWLTGGGFENVAELLYLVCPRARFASRQPHAELAFEPTGERGCTIEDHKRIRLAAIVERTYEKSLDCPVLQGVRSINDVISGYEATGEFDSSRWFLVRRPHRQADIGCLILTAHPRERRSEIVYMGVVSEERGKGVGLQIARHAQWLAGQVTSAEKSSKELILAVDAMNLPAVRLYEKAGFECRARRSLFLRVVKSK